jgi:hypothetical protein
MNPKPICIWKETEPDKWQCPVCGKPYEGTRPPIRGCDGPPKPGESPKVPIQAAPELTEEAKEAAVEVLGWTLADIKHWGKAVAKWYKAGKPVRTDEEVAAIFAICSACPNFDKINKRCSICRCRIRTSGLAIRNKAKMATETCEDPKGSRWTEAAIQKAMKDKTALVTAIKAMADPPPKSTTLQKPRSKVSVPAFGINGKHFPLSSRGVVV